MREKREEREQVMRKNGMKKENKHGKRESIGEEGRKKALRGR